MAKSIKLECINVAGGWQSNIKNTPYVFGPIYMKIQDLWAWQRKHVYGVQ
jgi:hypothetical protein